MTTPQAEGTAYDAYVAVVNGDGTLEEKDRARQKIEGAVAHTAAQLEIIEAGVANAEASKARLLASADEKLIEAEKMRVQAAAAYQDAFLAAGKIPAPEPTPVEPAPVAEAEVASEKKG